MFGWRLRAFGGLSQKICRTSVVVPVSPPVWVCRRSTSVSFCPPSPSLPSFLPAFSFSSSGPRKRPSQTKLPRHSSPRVKTPRFPEMSAPAIFAFLTENNVSADTLAMGLTHLAKKNHDRAAIEHLATAKLSPVVSGLSIRGLVMAVSACAKVGMQQSPLMLACLAQLPSKAHSIDARGIAMVLNAVSKMKSKVQALPTLKLLLPEAQCKVRDFNAQAIANTLNAMSKLEHYDKAVFEVLLSEAQRKVRGFNAQKKK